MIEKELKAIYAAIGWPEDPESEEGSSRYENLSKYLSKLLKGPLSFLKKKEEVKLLDLCSGTGIGGICLANLLSSEGISVDLTLMDLRDNALLKHRKWKIGKGIKVKVRKGDVLREDYGRGYDLISIFGYSLPHFSPIDSLKIFSKASLAVNEEGALILEEHDRIYSYIINGPGYKEFFVTNVDEAGNPIIEVHSGYDIRRGMVRKTIIRTGEFQKVGKVEAHLWSISEIIALLYCFFSEVEFFSKEKRGHGYLVAKRPIRKLLPSDLPDFRSFISL